MSLDIELALIDYSKEEIAKLQNMLPDGYYCEEKYHIGWGLVIRGANKNASSPDEAIYAFVSGIKNILQEIKPGNRVLRLGAFFTSATLTINLGKALELIQLLSIQLEITAYPTEEEE